MKLLKAYMGFDRGFGPAEGAVLVFAHTAREARRLAWYCVRGWFDTEWIDVEVKWLRNPPEHLYTEEADPEKLAAGEAHVIENPKVCPHCELWGGHRNNDGTCELCE